MLKNFQVGAVLLMAGEGVRFGGPVPKQFERLAGKKIFLHTLEAFLEASWIDEIVLVAPSGWVKTVQEEVGEKARVVAGGSSRQESSFNGLKGFSKKIDIVLIHDAVRPFVTGDLLEKNALGAIEWGAVDTCIPSNDTLVYAPRGETIVDIPLRAQFLRGQTPQSFRYDLIVRAHEEALLEDVENASDDCRLVLRLGHKIGIILGDEHNRKITTELDLFLAEQILRLRKKKDIQGTGSIKGKRFAILGGFGGIGSAVCSLLEKEGAVATPLSRKTGVDLTKPFSLPKIFQELGPLDGLINCAGSLKVKPLEHHALEEIEELIQVNFTGLVIACQQAQIQNGGHIINVASSAYTRGRKNYGIYSAAKAAVINFTQALAEEKPHLCIHAVIPQRTKTAMRERNFPDEDPTSLLEPLDVAKTILELLKDSKSTGDLVEVKKPLP